MLRGVPFNSTDEEIYKFFTQYRFIQNSVIFGMNKDDRRTGYVALLFESEEEASKAVKEKQGASIRHRWIELFLKDYGFYCKFNSKRNVDGYVPLASFITKENKSRVVVLQGLPYSADETTILEFMKDYPIVKSDIVIEKKSGKSTGRAIVFLANQGKFLQW